MLYRLDTVIDDKTLDELINVINSLTPFETFTLYIKGEGGETAVSHAIINILSDLRLTNNVVLVGYEMMCSAHFNIFFETLCSEKILLSDTKGMCHKPFWNIRVSENAQIKNDLFEHFKKAVMEECTTFTDLTKVIKFTKQELKELRNNRDIYILPSRMKEMLEYNKTKRICKSLEITLPCTM